MKFKIETGDKNKILRSISEKIDKNAYKTYIKIGEEMIKFLKNPNNSGVGIAAPQIGMNKRLIAVSLLKTYDDTVFKTIMMLNPEITEFSEEKEADNEGCLSVPKKFGDVIRAKTIKVRFIDSKGQDSMLILSSISARIVQHEIDHLDGILFTDKLLNNENITTNNHVL